MRNINFNKALYSAVFALCLLSGFSTLSAAENTLRIAIQGAFPPFSMLTGAGERSGFDVDIATALCLELNAQCEFIETGFADLIPGLQNKEFDAVIASLSITEKRRKLVAFTGKYYESPARFIARSGAEIKVSDSGLRGKRVGVKRGTTFENYLSDNYQGIAEISRYSSHDEALLDLVLERLDLVLGDYISLDQNFLGSEIGFDFEFVGVPLSDPRWFGEGIGIAVNQQDEMLRSRLDQAILQIRANGTYQQVRQKYFDYDIYDGLE